MEQKQEMTASDVLATVAPRRRVGVSRYVMLLPAMLLVLGLWQLAAAFGPEEPSGLALAWLLGMGVPVGCAAWTTGRVGGLLTALAGSLAVVVLASDAGLAGSLASLAAPGTWLPPALTLVALAGVAEATVRLRRQRDIVRQLRRQVGALRDSHYTHARRDKLTGLLNARELRQRLTEEVLRASRYEHPISLVYAGLEAAPGVRSPISEAGWTEARRALGSVLASACRTTDIAGRIDDDEFVVMLAETGPGAAARAANRLRSAMFEAGLGIEDSAFVFSMGIASWPDPDRPRSSLTGERLLEAAASAWEASRRDMPCTVIATAL